MLKMQLMQWVFTFVDLRIVSFNLVISCLKSRSLLGVDRSFKPNGAYQNPVKQKYIVKYNSLRCYFSFINTKLVDFAQ